MQLVPLVHFGLGPVLWPRYACDFGLTVHSISPSPEHILNKAGQGRTTSGAEQACYCRTLPLHVFTTAHCNDLLDQETRSSVSVTLTDIHLTLKGRKRTHLFTLTNACSRVIMHMTRYMNTCAREHMQLHMYTHTTTQTHIGKLAGMSAFTAECIYMGSRHKRPLDPG